MAISCWFRLVRLGTVAVCLTVSGCQDSDWGQSLQSAIAPSSSTSSLAKVESSPLPIAQVVNNLPPDFPPTIPIYPKAKISNLVANQLLTSGAVTWISPDPSDRILDFYRQQLSKPQWQIERSNPDKAEQQFSLVATNQAQTLQVSVRAISSDQTEIFVQYQAIPTRSLDSKSEQVSPVQPISATFSDLNSAPQALQPYIQDLNQLGILTAVNTNLFLPNRAVSRREMARWLFMANNIIFGDRLPRQIRPAQPNDRPSFSDIGNNDPDFGAIQGLVNAGLLRVSSLNTRFQPEAMISREEVLIWKVPFDHRQLNNAVTVANVKQIWGFQDSDRLSTRGLQVVVADAQSGDLANIRRAFGFTTILQPKKPVTRAEAAAILWYFGDQNDGLSAQTAIAQRDLKQSGELKQTENKSSEIVPDPNAKTKSTQP